MLARLARAAPRAAKALRLAGPRGNHACLSSMSVGDVRTNSVALKKCYVRCPPGPPIRDQNARRPPHGHPQGRRGHPRRGGRVHRGDAKGRAGHRVRDGAPRVPPGRRGPRRGHLRRGAPRAGGVLRGPREAAGPRARPASKLFDASRAREFRLGRRATSTFAGARVAFRSRVRHRRASRPTWASAPSSGGSSSSARSGRASSWP